MKKIQTIHSTVHKLNDELEKVNVLKIKQTGDPIRAKATASELHGLLARFSARVETLLDTLE